MTDTPTTLPIPEVLRVSSSSRPAPLGGLIAKALRERGRVELEAMGVLAGVPDLTLLMPNAQASFIELKAPRSALSPEQIEFRRKVTALKCGYAVCSSVEEVEAVAARWLGAFGLKLKARIAA